MTLKEVNQLNLLSLNLNGHLKIQLLFTTMPNLIRLCITGLELPYFHEKDAFQSGCNL